MIHQAIKPISDKICDLCWVERYGGIVKVVSNPKINMESGEKTIQRFPISCTVKGEDCWDKGLYKNLVPDCDVKSIVYLELLRTYPPVDSPKHGKGVKLMSYDLRIVVWANMPKLGYDECTIVDRLLMTIMACICDFKFDTEPNYIGEATVKLLGINSWQKTLSSVFGQYNYRDQQALYLAPYDIGSMDINVSFPIAPACYDPQSFQCLEPLECVRYD